MEEKKTRSPEYWGAILGGIMGILIFIFIVGQCKSFGKRELNPTKSFKCANTSCNNKAKGICSPNLDPNRGYCSGYCCTVSN
jgi:hypothetical protein